MEHDNFNFGPDFDQHFNFGKHTKMVRRVTWLVVGIWAAWILFILSLIGGLGYVAIHFLSKIW